eukprot:GHVU01139175.1.p1 GENE.GHVU01139175.1~~GHVU01139175.1.p1  ORF type:complete len:141 (+),score=8.58 GHVU01139175.1:854-1276(+)
MRTQQANHLRGAAPFFHVAPEQTFDCGLDCSRVVEGACMNECVCRYITCMDLRRVPVGRNEGGMLVAIRLTPSRDNGIALDNVCVCMWVGGVGACVYVRVCVRVSTGCALCECRNSQPMHVCVQAHWTRGVRLTERCTDE